MTNSLDSRTRVLFVDRLLDWFAVHARSLPWRQGRTPYRVWVAEVMLQQTQVKTVVPYYERFLARFPTVQAVAGAPLEQVLKVWEGLGYYARARHLHAAARQVVERHGGRIPGTFEELLALPGVGRYTAGAVASIGFGQDVPAVDGNVRRVLCRVFGVRDDVTRSATQRRLEGLARELLPSGRAGRFNEALIELGATVCTPRALDCAHCPLGELCQARAEGMPEMLPVRPKRRRIPHYDVTAAVTLRADGRVLVAQRMPDDLLGGLWEFPGGKREEGETLVECLVREMQEEMAVQVAVGEEVAVVEHAYTHFRITLHAFCCRLVDGELRCLECADFRWVTLEYLDDLPMSVVNRKVVRVVQAMGCAGLSVRL